MKVKDGPPKDALAYAGNISGVQVYGQPRKGSGGALTPDAEEFSKSWKIFLKKIAKLHYFSLFFKSLFEPSVTLSRVWTKTQLVWIFLRKF